MISKLHDNYFTAELSTKVLGAREDNDLSWHACKDTIFYEEGGGIANDIGMTDEYMILDLKCEEGHMRHLLDTRPEGTVSMSVNLHKRFRKYQVHTAWHLVSMALGSVYRVETLAHHVGDEENDTEFSFKDSTDKMTFELQVLCNGLIRSDLGVSIQHPTRTEASRVVRGKNLDYDDLCIVRIGALDYNICGCIRVPSLRYLQMLYISEYEKTIEGYEVKHLVGDQLLDYISGRYKVLDEAGRSLAVSHLYVSTGVNRLIDKTRQLNRDIVVWKQKYYEVSGKELGQSEEDIIIHFFDNIDVKSETDVAKYVTENYKEAVIFAVKTYDNVHVVVAPHKDTDLGSAKAFKETTNAYHLKGGGSARLSQRGGMYSEEIVKFIRTHRFSRKTMIY